MKTEYKRGMLFESYAEVKACHKSALKNVDTAKHLKKFEDDVIDSDALRFGRIFHLALLEPDHLEDLEIYDDQEWIPKAEHPEKISINDQKKQWKEDRLKDETDYYKNADEKKAIKEMAQAVLGNPLAKSFLSGDGEAETSLFWTDKKTGLPCKTRLDWLRSDDIIVEVKSDADPSPESFGKKVYNFGYHIGAWFNREGFQEVFKRVPKGFVYIVVGKTAPFAVSVYMMSARDFELGGIDAVPLMQRYKTIKAGGYQDYNQGSDGRYEILPVFTPGWEVKRLERAQADNNEEENEESAL